MEKENLIESDKVMEKDCCKTKANLWSSEESEPSTSDNDLPEKKSHHFHYTAVLRNIFAHKYKYILIGLIAAFSVFGFYLGLLTLTAGWSSAQYQFNEYKYWISALAVGLGVQAALFFFLRSKIHGRSKTAAGSSLAASGGLSTASMAACCVHYLVAVLPALGLPFLSAALAGIERYQTYFFLIGVLSNLFGIAMMLRIMKKNGIISGRKTITNLVASLEFQSNKR